MFSFFHHNLLSLPVPSTPPPCSPVTYLSLHVHVLLSATQHVTLTVTWRKPVGVLRLPPPPLFSLVPPSFHIFFPFFNCSLLLLLVPPFFFFQLFFFVCSSIPCSVFFPFFSPFFSTVIYSFSSSSFLSYGPPYFSCVLQFFFRCSPFLSVAPPVRHSFTPPLRCLLISIQQVTQLSFMPADKRFTIRNFPASPRS